MATVVLPDNFSALTNGERELSTKAQTYRELVAELILRWPQLEDLLDKTAVAIDGQIYQEAFLEEIGADSEVFFMARIEGG
ncbi:MAG: MoaD/ThiS family protein [Gammaproteobacteria bacterium]|nr:MoaD/ThiS family protein [Gammaproteobacteria bacterium]